VSIQSHFAALPQKYQVKGEGQDAFANFSNLS